MAKRGRKTKKRKAVKVQFIDRIHAGKVVECYAIAERIIASERADLKEVNIGFAWNTSWRPDADGYLQIGKCTKRKDLDRELDAYDFIILLNRDAWQSMPKEKKERWIFHELEHAQISLDTSGEPKKDDRGRVVTRIKKHDIEEFRSVVDKYGLSDDMSKLAQAAIADAQRPLLAEIDKKSAEPSGEKGMAATVAEEEKDFDGEVMDELAKNEKAQKANGKRKRQRKVKDMNGSP